MQKHTHIVYIYSNTNTKRFNTYRPPSMTPLKKYFNLDHLPVNLSWLTVWSQHKYEEGSGVLYSEEVVHTCSKAAALKFRKSSDKSL